MYREKISVNVEMKPGRIQWSGAGGGGVGWGGGGGGRGCTPHSHLPAISASLRGLPLNTYAF